jgi:hypothetical protein
MSNEVEVNNSNLSYILVRLSKKKKKKKFSTCLTNELLEKKIIFGQSHAPKLDLT